MGLGRFNCGRSGACAVRLAAPAGYYRCSSSSGSAPRTFSSRSARVRWMRRRARRSSRAAASCTGPPPSHALQSEAQTVRDYEIALLDFTRFCVIDGVVLPDDVWLMEEANHLLTAVDGGRALAPEEYHVRILGSEGEL